MKGELTMEDFNDYHIRETGHPVHYIQCQCSTAHTFGNVTAYIQNYLINLFPKDFFKTIHVNSKIAHTQLRSTPNEFLKKQTPAFIIRPRIDWNDTNKFLNGTPIIQRQGDLYHTYGGTNLQEFFKDDKNKLAVKYQLNRYVMNFDVILIVNTLMKQINWASYFQNAVRQNIPFNLDTCLESYISPEMLKQISNLSGVPMIDEEGTINSFMRYMNANSYYPITYKLQGSTGTEEFYRYYPVRMDCLISDFNTDEGEKQGQIQDKYQISFTLRCEFFATGFYYLFSDKVEEMSDIILDDDSSTIIPLFTDVMLREDIDLPLGWHLYASPSCRLEERNDTINLSELLAESIKTAIKFHLDKGIPLLEFFKIRIREQGRLLQEEVHWKFNPETYDLEFINCSTYYTYKILIMINIEYINKLIKDVYELK